MLTRDIASLAISNNGDFGTVARSDKPKVTVRLTNTSSDKAIVLENITLALKNQGFALSSFRSPDTLDISGNALASANVLISFEAPGLGDYYDTLLVQSLQTKRLLLHAFVNATGPDTLSVSSLPSDTLLSTPEALDSAGTRTLSINCQRFKTLDTTINIQNLSLEHRVRIESFTITNPSGQFSVLSQPSTPLVLGTMGSTDSRTQLRIRYQPTQIAAGQRLSIKLGSAAKPEIAVIANSWDYDTVSVDAVPSICSIKQPRLSFDTVRVNSSKTLSAQIQNTSPKPTFGGTFLRIPSLTVDDTVNFQVITAAPIVIAPQATIPCSIRFKPLSIGRFTTLFYVGSSGAQLSLDGIGMRPDTVSIDSLIENGGKLISDSLDLGLFSFKADSALQKTIFNNNSFCIRIDTITTIANGQNTDEIFFTSQFTYPIYVQAGAALNLKFQLKALRSGFASLTLRLGRRSMSTVTVSATVQ